MKKYNFQFTKNSLPTADKLLLACLDLGNTRVHLGVFNGLKPLKTSSLPAKAGSLYKLISHIHRRELIDVCYTSVTPQLDRDLERVCKKLLCIKPRKIPRDIKPPIQIKTKQPAKVGIDRICNAVAAIYKIRKSCIVIDIGTAITIDVVSKTEGFLGGMIAPGPSIMTHALNDYCRLLPLVEPGCTKLPIGKDTISCIQAGVFFAVKGLLKEAIKSIKQGMRSDLYVFGTGGAIDNFKDIFDEIDPYLTLKGIALCYYNQ